MSIPGIVETLLNLPAALLAGIGDPNPLILAQEIPVPDRTIGWVRFELNPALFTTPSKFKLTREVQISGGAWLPHGGSAGDILPEHISGSELPGCEWGYNTNDEPYRGNAVKLRFVLAITGSMFSPVSITKFDLPLPGAVVINPNPGDIGGV